MCSNLSDLFACIRVQGNSDADADSDLNSTTHQRNSADVDDVALDPQSDSFRRQQLQLLIQQNEKSRAIRQDPLPSPTNNSIRRYDQVFGSAAQSKNISSRRKL
ncbi:uncharacterized protein LOC108137263 [Drosophila elegans]|uniref:uncharacterized protein LOC108137263 n=1 Tax=Drosophila elegans TaxID=30023 RepID=UPI0007E7E62F|nr:uncharacterized protein LOC108137263 [Drosophila elegans]